MARLAHLMTIAGITALTLTFGAEGASAASASGSPSLHVVTEVPVSGSPIGIAINPLTGTAYAAAQGPNEVAVIKAGARTVTKNIPVPALDSFFTEEMAVDPDNNTVWVPSGNGQVYVISGASRTIIDTISLTGGSPGPGMVTGAAVDDATNTVYVANNSLDGTSGTVSVINGRTDAVTATIAISGSAQYVAVNQVTGTLYVTGTNGNVTVINGRTRAITDTINVGPAPDSITVNSLTGTIYVGNDDTNAVTVINGITNTVTATIPVAGGSPPFGVAVNPFLDAVYAAGGNGVISEINGRTNTVTNTINLGNVLPFAIAVDPLTGAVYVADRVGDIWTLKN